LKQEPENSGHVRVLIIDEQLEYFQSLSEYAELCYHQYHVICRHAASDAEANQILAVWQPEVILVDLHHSKADTLSIIDQCKEGFAKVIVTSENVSSEVEKSALERGAMGYFYKSFDPEDIERLLARIEAIAECRGFIQ